MRIFIAGATGVIGRRAIPQLLAAGHRLTALARSPEKQATLEGLGVKPSGADLFSPSTLNEAVRGHEVVINIATHVPPSSRALLPGAWRATGRIRRTGSANLSAAALAAGAERFIQESFAPIYEDGGDAWLDERSPVRPARYNRTTRDAEASAERFTKNGGAGIALRFAFLYGPDSDFLADTIKFVKKGWAATFGSGEGFISSLSHDDAAAAVVAAVSAPAGVYNVADDEPLRRRDYFAALAGLLGVGRPKLAPVWIKYLAGSIGETIARSQRISNRKLRGATGWAPRYPSVREGFRAVIAGSA
jgi:nucleoside-diphosphate-sugar epimerase